MRLFLIEDHEVPVISGLARIRTGNLFDPADKVGLATMTGLVMRTGGTREMNGEQLDRKLEDMAASVESSIGESAGEVSFFSLAENSTGVLEAFRDVLTAPVFRMDKVELARAQLRGFVSRRNDDANGILTRTFAGILYGEDTPYGWDMQYEHIDRIARADLQGFYKRYFFPKNVLLAIAGDFDTAKMKEQLEQLFGGWTVQQPPVPEFPEVRNKPAPGIYLARKNDVTQAFFSIGHLSGKVNDKDYPALTVMADILGGGFSSRLFLEIRTRMGNAYNISADWGAAFDHPGLFKITGSTKSISTVTTVKAIQKEVDRIRTDEVSDEELHTAKDGAFNRLVFAYDTRKKVLNRTVNYAYFGYPPDFLQQYQKALAAVTRADVLRVAKEYLRPADLTILVVGNPDDIAPSLDSLGSPAREIDMTIPASKVHAAATDEASLEQGKRILARVQQAVGGADKIAAVKDYTAVSDVRMSAAGGGMTASEMERWMAPGNIREEGDTAQGRVVVYSDGKSGWVTRGRASGILLGTQLKALQGDLFRAYFSLLLSDRVAGRTVSALDEDTIEIASADGLAVQIAVNPETGLPERFSYLQPLASGPPALIQETITQFGEVAGLRVPYQHSTRREGNAFSESSVKEFKVNSGLVLTDLERRP
jgi:zinc protease